MRLEHVVASESRPYPLDTRAKPEALITAAQDGIDRHAQKNLPNTSSIGHVGGSTDGLRQLCPHPEAYSQNQVEKENRWSHHFNPKNIPLSEIGMHQSNHQAAENQADCRGLAPAQV